MISCIPKNIESQRVVNRLGVAKNKTYHSTSHCIKEKINPRPRKAYNVKIPKVAAETRTSKKYWEFLK